MKKAKFFDKASLDQYVNGGAIISNLNFADIQKLDKYVLETGVIAMSGNASELAKDPKVKAAYLGGI